MGSEEVRTLRIAAGTLVIIAVLLTGCGGSDDEALEWLSLVLSVSNAIPHVGENTSLQLTATNTGDIPYALTFPTSQRYDFIARDANGEVVWTWSHDRAFAQVTSRETIHPGETWTYTETWDLHGNDGDALAAAQNTVAGELASIGERQSNTVSLTIEPAP